MLLDGGGNAETRSFRWLINRADLRLLPAAEAPERPAPVVRQPSTLADLAEDQMERSCAGGGRRPRARFPPSPTRPPTLSWDT
ncbi:hypothetical protein GCM10010259_37030 [Streptomyces daghestanicus]|uniref:Uncharacterized protein n=1 Tax=Streptomyces daghestanicus TaxID=66885 RepID=A0ABQ3PUI8_9ACTN|nr:hypothetical protein GCM10010259_37030 [Streptomyces daghestanicus]GHI28690.1 hypothetical protein Sdagh_04200 [Streptomyces daghestanicus]